jgi:hypothetical protein
MDSELKLHIGVYSLAYWDGIGRMMVAQEQYLIFFCNYGTWHFDLHFRGVGMVEPFRTLSYFGSPDYFNIYP